MTAGVLLLKGANFRVTGEIIISQDRETKQNIYTEALGFPGTKT